MHNIISIAAIKALTRLPVKEAVGVQSVDIRYSNLIHRWNPPTFNASTCKHFATPLMPAPLHSHGTSQMI